MADLPIPIRDFIYAVTEDTLTPAYLLVTDGNRLAEWGGDLDSYGITSLEKNMQVGDHLAFLAGVLPLDDTGSVFLPSVQIQADVYTDVYLFRRAQGTWVLFLDATAQVKKQQTAQQRTYNATLQVGELEREGEALTEVNTLLEQRVSEQTAELSLTVVRLQQELAEGRRIEKALRESEARFRLVFDSNMLAIVFWDVGGKVTGANDAFLDLLGYTRVELEEGSIEWNQITNPDVQGLDTQLAAEISDTLTQQARERRFFRKDGGRVSLLFGASPLEGWTNKLVGFALKLSPEMKTLDRV
jgi:PAS domain S-box-containing protein